MSGIFWRTRPGGRESKNRGSSDARARRLAETLAHELEPASLLAGVTAALREFSGCDRVVYFAANDGRAFVPLASAPDAASDPDTTVDPQSRLIRWLRNNGETLDVVSNRPVVEYLDAADRQFLYSWSARACLPLLTGKTLMGFALLASSNGWHPRRGLLAELQAICGQAAASLTRARWHQAERERLEVAARAQQLAMAGQVAAAIAHEIKNPLTAIRSSIQFVLGSPGDSTVKAALLNGMVLEADRIQNTVSGLLGLGRKTDLQLEELDYADVVDRALLMTSSYVSHHQVTLETNLAERPLPVRGDAAELQRVIVNVLFNACHATPAGRIRVSSHIIAPGAGGGDGGRVRVMVADNGCGMSSEQLRRAFDQFYTTKKDGTGLGLPICRDLMTRHGGAIDLDSQPGRGTTVTLSLPMRAI